MNVGSSMAMCTEYEAINVFDTDVTLLWWKNWIFFPKTPATGLQWFGKYSKKQVALHRKMWYGFGNKFKNVNIAKCFSNFMKACLNYRFLDVSKNEKKLSCFYEKLSNFLTQVFSNHRHPDTNQNCSCLTLNSLDVKKSNKMLI